VTFWDTRSTAVSDDGPPPVGSAEVAELTGRLLRERDAALEELAAERLRSQSFIEELDISRQAPPPVARLVAVQRREAGRHAANCVRLSDQLADLRRENERLAVELDALVRTYARALGYADPDGVS